MEVLFEDIEQNYHRSRHTVLRGRRSNEYLLMNLGRLPHYPLIAMPGYVDLTTSDDDSIIDLPNSDDDIDNLFDAHYHPTQIPIEFTTTISRLLESHISSSPKDCSICYEENSVRMGYRFIPCGHDLMCIDCIRRLERDLCPFCREKITDVMRI